MTSSKEELRVNAYYFYVHDREFGAGFIKICSYFPYPAKVWLNGHEWAKRQAEREGLGYAALTNGFAACPEPARLQATCDRFGPFDAQAVFDRWTAVIRSRSLLQTALPATGGSCRCARPGSPARWSSTTRAGPVASSSRSSPTTSASEGPSRSPRCSPPRYGPAGLAGRRRPRAPSREMRRGSLPVGILPVAATTGAPPRARFPAGRACGLGRRRSR
jgi:hypothetical protein